MQATPFFVGGMVNIAKAAKKSEGGNTAREPSEGGNSSPAVLVGHAEIQESPIAGTMGVAEDWCEISEAQMSLRKEGGNTDDNGEIKEDAQLVQAATQQDVDVNGEGGNKEDDEKEKSSDAEHLDVENGSRLPHGL